MPHATEEEGPTQRPPTFEVKVEAKEWVHLQGGHKR
jgi:hypothetical protein